MPFNPKNTLKNSFLNFVRYFYDENLTYANTLPKKWIKALIPFIFDIILTGLVFYFTLSGLVFVFPKLSNYIFVGTEFWHILKIILYLGVIRWFFEDIYKFIKGGYKK